jgi:prepilin-type N-terminal cleavage/methylation domain-containing protein
MNTMQNQRGFSLWELIIVIAIIAIVSTIAIPNMFGARGRAKVGGAVENLKGDLNYARITAVRECAMVVVRFDENGYLIFVDRNADANPINWVFGSEDRQFRNRQLPSGVSLDASDLPDNVMRFNRRGLPENLGADNLGTIGMTGFKDSRQIQINMVGLIDVQ